MDRKAAMASPPHCPVCAAGPVVPSDRFSGSSWPVVECRSCGTGFLSPIPTVDAVAGYYAYEEYGRVTYESDRGRREARQRALRELLALVEARRGGPGSLVDLGCSTGDMLEAGRARGWAVTGIELDPETARRARERLGVPVLAGPAIEQLETLGRFDLVVMSHWLEHVPDPGRAFERAAAHLAPGGLVLLRVPNSASRLARLTGRGWSWFIPGVHLYYFAPSSLGALAGRAGVELVESRTVQGDALAFPFELALGYVRRSMTPGGAPPGSGPVRAAGSGARRRLLDVYCRLAGGIGRAWGEQRFSPLPQGPELVAVFRRGSGAVATGPAPAGPIASP